MSFSCSCWLGLRGACGEKALLFGRQCHGRHRRLSIGPQSLSPAQELLGSVKELPGTVEQHVGQEVFGSDFELEDIHAIARRDLLDKLFRVAQETDLRLGRSTEQQVAMRCPTESVDSMP